ncbi:MAG: isochorismatase family protein [Deltaproteobacteria bacterium]|nr:isochorismatase family protein [Deltaproteobacteria bacterium]
MLTNLKLSRDHAALLVIDVQERLLLAMPEEERGPLTRATRTLVEGAKHLGVPVFATEQYPRGLGPTIPEIKSAFPQGVLAFDKLDFSCQAVGGLMAALESTGRKQVIACGMETHVCVFQTVRDLSSLGFQVFVPEDAVASRTPANRRVGLSLMERAGAVGASTEALLFDMLGRAGTGEFKAISALVK